MVPDFVNIVQRGEPIVSGGRLQRRSNKRSAVNIGLIIFLFIGVYILISFLVSLNKPKANIYQVQKISLATNNLARAVVVREEQNISTEASGYVNYYLKSGTRVSKNVAVYSVDDSRQLSDAQKTKIDVQLQKENVDDIKECITNYTKTYLPGDFSKITELKSSMSAEIVSISDMYRLENLERLSSGGDGSLKLCKSPSPGIVSFYTDSLDGLTADTVDLETFDETHYNSSTLYSAELREAGSTAYKLITNENWSLVLNLSEEQFLALDGQKKITFTISDDSLTLTTPVSIYKKGDGYFARIDLAKYLIRYVNKRFLTVAINLVQSSGLKIPRKAIVDKYFYVVPKQFIINDQNRTGITICEIGENNEYNYRFYEAEVYYYDDEYAYIDESVLQKHGQSISLPNTTMQYQVSTQKKLEGVYCVNKGYAQFRMIERLYNGEDYVIVKSGMDRSINVYDYIWGDAATLDEGQLITR